MTSNIMALGTQGCTQTTTAIGATTGKKNRLSMHAVLANRFGCIDSATRCVVTRATDVQRLTDLLDRGLLR
ncbi:hypothetical protein Y974_01850 [Klebsiella pneumoniae UHKPC 52]|uniref:Uncharacterized protein n=1 Tax=Enterobacter cloacae subsp. cloacae TaxID=336306 RepID=A0AAE2JNQ2_ENTCL|nr:hypothetical protein KPNIH10_11405 [Klebsiella pneumoniae subsp. pneumoniae KPNIH10]AID96855.1 hypothetical protein KPNIH24_16840 [Klebsiella pneumoniae subsp. pneumoniae KPNIH24]AIE22827.1 hypothetical protein KPNIH1_11410 [Klebsiella pneumoniae subsp. pneumoniae KPNIH1]AIE28225.1 hypothetical protein KPR0928_11415 [Klebsiella pneumoniae subsp. pneumoniae KPR0928]AIJ40533.1 hypothetical protein FH42_07385 [Klebsiella pneumoniae]AIW70867.1 hypothetical protein KPNIH33_12070 [Klebsiella pneu